MDSNKAALAWLVAIVLMGTTALFAWQHARARREAALLRTDYETLQKNYDALQQRLDTYDAESMKLLQQHTQLRDDYARIRDEIERMEAELMSEVTRRIQRESETSPTPE